MDLRAVGGTSESRFDGYVEHLCSTVKHADRASPLRAYCLGLMLPGDRKSVEPMAARVEPGRVQAAHQSLHHFVAKADWSEEAMLAAVRDIALPAIERHGSIRAWIIDDTGFPKKGIHSVGVARQYCGQLGKQDNCQVAVTLSVANDYASLPIAFRLYLPEAWAADPVRRKKAGVPEEVVFQTKPQIALAQIKAARAAGVSPGVLLADAGYGVDSNLRRGLSELGLTYVVGIQSQTSLWPPGMAPLPPEPYGGRGRPPVRLQRNDEHKPVSAKQVAQDLPPEAWRMVTWREGTNIALCSRFAAVRLRTANRDMWRKEPHPEEWFLAEWPEDQPEPTKYWLSTLPDEMPLAALVEMAKMRWRIERDFQDLKQELGLGHYEGRGWRGFHHHAALCVAAYGFLITERSLIPPSGPRSSPFRQAPGLPDGYRPRGSPSSA